MIVRRGFQGHQIIAMAAGDCDCQVGTFNGWRFCRLPEMVDMPTFDVSPTIPSLGCQMPFRGLRFWEDGGRRILYELSREKTVHVGFAQ